MLRKLFFKLIPLPALIIFGFLLIAPLGKFLPQWTSIPSAHAGFFNNDLELLEEVVELIADKYLYPPDYKKLFSTAIDFMIKSFDRAPLSVDKSTSGQQTLMQTRSGAKTQFNLNYNREADMASLRKVYNFLLQESGEKLNKEDLETAGVIGVMNSLDPYSQYLDKSAFDKSVRDTEGRYGGLGMVITMSDNKLIVVKTMKDSPAERVGIQPDDIFVKVNGNELQKMHIRELAEILRGYPNTKVSITLMRPSNGKERTYPLIREIISIETVEYKTLGNDIGYITISSFSKQTNDQLKEALASAKNAGVKAFILDLRDNPGGLLHQSVKVASHFLFRNRLIVYTKGRSQSDYKEYRAKYKNSLLHMPVVVLINQHSASASEIVAGALKDSGRALIIGENSYGKGSVQTIFRISDGSGLRLTTSKYYTPSGTDITEYGIVPEIKILRNYPDEEETGSGEISGATELLNQAGTPILLKESDVEKYLKEKGWVVDRDHDPILQFAHMLIENVTISNKTKTLEKAKELAANIHY